jgi:hypothetical protein
MTEERRGPPGPIKRVTATVTGVPPKKGYVFATSPDIDGEITFSLTRDVWAEDVDPRVNNKVILEDIRLTKTPQGDRWRAYSARLVRPESRG